MWPAIVCSVTEGKITVSKSVPSPESQVSYKRNIPNRRPGIVSLKVPWQFRKELAIEFSTPEVRYIKAGCQSSVDDTSDAMKKIASGNSKEKILSQYFQQNKDAPIPSMNLSRIVDNVTQELRVVFCGNVEKYGLVIQTISQDLKLI